MKCFTILLLLLTSFFARSQEILMMYTQSIDITGGASLTKFHDFANKHWRQNGYSNYKTRPGYVIRIGLDLPYHGKINPRFDLTLENYGGYINVDESSPAGSFGTKGDVRKTNLTLGLTAIHYANFWKNLKVVSGPTISGLVSEKASGSFDYLNTSHDLDKDYNPFNSKVLLGYRIGIVKAFGLTEKYGISLQYMWSLTLTKEFREYPSTTRAGRHAVTVGLYKNRKKKNVAYKI